jgi:alginate O-acetyltransferase complex protein AlgI
MLFNSLTFVIFMMVVLLLHNLPFPWKIKKINLLAASYLFYMVWNPPFVVLLWLSTLVDYLVGLRLGREDRPAQRKALLLISLLVNLGLLGFYKYGGFLLENFTALLQLAGVEFRPAPPDIVLPVGISFYTFQTLSYTLDVYHRKAAPEKSLLDFSLFVTFFPQLVAGPIVRPNDLIPQFKQPVTATASQLTWGFFLLSLGLFMKVALADALLSGPADTVFRELRPLLAGDAWLGVLAFTGQIFCDFAGYSTCAIGVALCMGFILPENFRYPYAAIGFSDFWRRWHISFSTWLRDYLYIPLGGNRKGVSSTYVNLMLTMLLGGLWHGAAWTFVVWGALHGLFLIVERLLRNRFGGQAWVQSPLSQVGLGLLTFLLVNVTWVFFRAPSFSVAWNVLQSMFGLQSGGVAVLSYVQMLQVVTVMSALVLTHWLMRNSHVATLAEKANWWLTGVSWASMVILVMLVQKTGDAFIYFQF